MVTEQNIILNLPLDEAEGSTIAYDYSSGRHDATVTDADFESGKQGNCLHFDGTGKAEIEADVINMSGDFTVLAWVKVPEFEDGVTGLRIGLFCNTSQQEEGYRELWVNMPLETWGFFVIKKEGDVIGLYLDTQLMGTIELPATLTGFGLLQDIYSTEYAVADIDEVRAYNLALTDEDINEILNEVKQLEYFIDGVNFKDYGIRVESSQGIIDLLSLKTVPTIDNDNYHGEMVDLSEKRYQPREITLNCWLKASGKMDYFDRLKKLYAHFEKEGTARLMCSIHPTKPLVYDVYCPEGVPQEKRWHDELMIGTFVLKVREPDPVKRVVRFQSAGNANTATLSFDSPKICTVSWGDGETETVHGQCTLSHTYTKNDIYYIIVGGVIEEIENFTTNGIVVWQRL